MNNDVYVATMEATGAFATFKRFLYLAIKRGFDIFASFIGLIFLIPIALLVKISYVLSGDFKTIFFVQERIGKDGKFFKFFKFRSMVVNADEVLDKLLKENPDIAEEYRINKKIKNDPRITKAGKILRKTSLDELPQLINVFLGDMSLIGNRPYLPREIDDMGDYFQDIVKTKPGLTGWWQVSGRSDCSFAERLKLEKYYSNHYGFKIDIKIFFKTFKVVLGCKGAEK